MTSSSENMMIERAQWRAKAKKKLAEIVGLVDDPVGINTLTFAALLASEAVKPLVSDRDFQIISKLPPITMAWILTMENDGNQVSINPHRSNALRKDDYPDLYSIYIRIKTDQNREFAVLPINPWNENFANLGDQLLTKKEVV